MNEDELKKQRCCFSGHRPEKIHNMKEEDIRRILRSEIERAIEDGYVTFISGMARGFDIWAAEIVLEIRERNPKIHLICACPFRGFHCWWSPHWRNRFEDIIKRCDLVRYIVPRPSRTAYKMRNRWMTEHSGRLISYWEGHPYTGTFNAIVNANGRGLEVYNIQNGRVKDLTQKIDVDNIEWMPWLLQ